MKLYKNVNQHVRPGILGHIFLKPGQNYYKAEILRMTSVCYSEQNIKSPRVSRVRNMGKMAVA